MYKVECNRVSFHTGQKDFQGRDKIEIGQIQKERIHQNIKKKITSKRTKRSAYKSNLIYDLQYYQVIEHYLPSGISCQDNKNLFKIYQINKDYIFVKYKKKRIR